MALTREQSNKIKVNETTEVAYINGEKIYAENLQKWVYRRLEMWPDLLASLKSLTDATKTINDLQHAGIPILPEHWSLLYQITNHAKGVMFKAEND